MLKQLFCILLCLMISQAAVAQSTTAAEKVFIDINTGFTFIENSFTQTWEAQPAWHVNLRIPFYAGQVEGGVRYTRYKGYAPSTTDSDFTSYYFYVGYSYPIEIFSWYQIAPVVRVGNNLMFFDEAEVYIYKTGTERFVTDKRESEFAYELALRNQFQLTDRWFIHASLSYNRTLTYYPLPVTVFSVGISYAFPQPDWLKDFIQ